MDDQPKSTETMDAPEPDAALDTEIVDTDIADEPEKLVQPKLKDLLRSSDPPSRLGTYLSLLFGFLSLFCLILFVVVMIQRKSKQQPPPPPEKAVYTQDVIPQESLGHFIVVIKSSEGQKVDHDLRVDAVAECNTDEACATLKTKLVLARDLINPILASANREEWLTAEGKLRMRRRIAEQLSGLIEPGKVENVHFTQVTIEAGRPSR